MRARIVMSTVIASFLFGACGDAPPPPVTSHSAALVLDAGVDADIPSENGLGTSPSRPDRAADDDPTK